MYEGYQVKRCHDFEHTRALWYIQVRCNWDSEKGVCPPVHELWPLPTDDEERSTIKESADAEFAHLMALMEAAEKNVLYN